MAHPANQAAPSAPAFFFECSQCRRPIHVEPRQAGSKVDCGCGALNVVPSVIHLQQIKPAAARSPSVSAPASPFAAPQPAGSPFAQQAAMPAPAAPNCPFCSRPMQYGRIIGERYQLKWLSADIPLTMGIWAVGGIPIGQGGFMQFNRPHVWGWRCGTCAKIIVDERA